MCHGTWSGLCHGKSLAIPDSQQNPCQLPRLPLTLSEGHRQLLCFMPPRFLLQGLVMNISVTLPALIIPLMTVIPQPAENAPLLSKAWTWHPYRPASALGTMGLALQSTETWTPLLKTEEAKVKGGEGAWGRGRAPLPTACGLTRVPGKVLCRQHLHGLQTQPCTLTPEMSSPCWPHLRSCSEPPGVLCCFVQH